MNFKGTTTRSFLLAAALSLPLCVSATPLSEDEFSILDSGEIHLAINDRPLADVLETLNYVQCIEYALDESLAKDRVSIEITTGNWEDLTRQVLQGFNWIQQETAGGNQQIYILERTDAVAERITDSDNQAAESFEDEEALDLSALDAEDALFAVGLSLTQADIEIPEALSAYPEHVLQAIELDMAQMQNLEAGDVITLNLPSGAQHVTYIETTPADEDGAYSWIGYLGDEDAHYDVIITQGTDGVFAHIDTPNGLQNIETINGQQWWIDVANSGLDQPDFMNDTFQLPTTPSLAASYEPGNTANLVTSEVNMSAGKSGSATNKWARRLALWKRQLKNTNNPRQIAKLKRKIRVAKRKLRVLNSSRRATASGTRIDLLTAYTSGVSPTRIKHLVKLANNAFNNSGVSISLRIVKMVNVSYTITNDNSNALTDLTYSNKQLNGIEQLRNQYKADLVTLVRPFRYPAQDSCGIAWLGGANGSNFHSITGFSVVSDGANNGYYCSNYTLAHEIGHNLGSAHDRAHAGAAGAYNYSYGYGESGKAGSIMSYINPEVGRFSSPNYQCNNITCGTSNANNVASMNKTRKVIANYK